MKIEISNERVGNHWYMVLQLKIKKVYQMMWDVQKMVVIFYVDENIM